MYGFQVFSFLKEGLRVGRGMFMPKEALQHFPAEHISQCVNVAVAV